MIHGAFGPYFTLNSRVKWASPGSGMHVLQSTAGLVCEVQEMALWRKLVRGWAPTLKPRPWVMATDTTRSRVSCKNAR